MSNLITIKSFFYNTIFCLILTLIVFSPSVFAIKYDLILPSGELTRGQQIQFTINIDSEGTSITTTQIGMTYETTALEYVSTVPGDAMGTVSVSQLETGKILFSGTNPGGFSGAGTFAYVNFKIIAAASGETQLCVLWAPQTNPTTPPSQPTSAPDAPQPTALPRTGEIKNQIGYITGSLLFGLIGLGGIMYLNNSRYQISSKKSQSHKKSTDNN